MSASWMNLLVFGYNRKYLETVDLNKLILKYYFLADQDRFISTQLNSLLRMKNSEIWSNNYCSIGIAMSQMSKIMALVTQQMNSDIAMGKKIILGMTWRHLCCFARENINDFNHEKSYIFVAVRKIPESGLQHEAMHFEVTWDQSKKIFNAGENITYENFLKHLDPQLLSFYSIE